MAWTDPRTWVTGELATAAMLNTNVRDNLNALGQDTVQRHAGTTDIECWYPCALCVLETPTGVGFTTGTLRAFPFFPRRGGTVDRLAFEVTGAVASSTARVGIYKTKGVNNIYPGDLVVESGAVDTSTTGAKSITISQVLSDFMYWAVYTSSATISCRGVGSTAPIDVLGYPSTLGTAKGTHLSVAFTYGALPATFPASAARDNNPIIFVYVRYSA